MRNFIYISRSKLTNYFEQLPAARFAKEKLAAKIKVPLASLEGEKEWVALPDVQKLLAVEADILDRHDVGTVDYPDLWTQERAEIRQVSLDRHSGSALFIGKKENTYFLLTGSAQHVIGATTPPAGVRLPMSYAPHFLQQLEKSIKLSDDNSAEWIQVYTSISEEHKAPFFAIDEHELSTIMVVMYDASKGLSMEVHFLGVKFFHFVREEPARAFGRFTVLSPLYIETV